MKAALPLAKGLISALCHMSHNGYSVMVMKSCSVPGVFVSAFTYPLTFFFVRSQPRNPFLSQSICNLTCRKQIDLHCFLMQCFYLVFLTIISISQDWLKIFAGKKLYMQAKKYCLSARTLAKSQDPITFSIHMTVRLNKHWSTSPLKHFCMGWLAPVVYTRGVTIRLATIRYISRYTTHDMVHDTIQNQLIYYQWKILKHCGMCHQYCYIRTVILARNSKFKINKDVHNHPCPKYLLLTNCVCKQNNKIS